MGTGRSKNKTKTCLLQGYESFKVKETTCLTEIMLWGIKIYWYPISFHREAMFHCHPQITSRKESYSALEWLYCWYNSLEKFQNHCYNSLFTSIVFWEGFYLWYWYCQVLNPLYIHPFPSPSLSLCQEDFFFILFQAEMVGWEKVICVWNLNNLFLPG